AHGIHLSSAQLRTLQDRPLPEDCWVAASCHDRSDIEQAQRIRADFIVLGPVAATRSHPQARPLGWDGFATLVADATVPVYALGGMRVQDVVTAWQSGAQGIAAIDALWNVADCGAAMRACARASDWSLAVPR
ncbi:MAG: thiamine phosphate synthase, partial [Aquabacterium sp.]